MRHRGDGLVGKDSPGDSIKFLPPNNSSAFCAGSPQAVRHDSIVIKLERSRIRYIKVGVCPSCKVRFISIDNSAFGADSASV